MGERKRIIFIGGYGRSGSTLLDRVLGHSSDRVFSGGEIRHVFREGYAENRRCGCGAAFRECPFWTAVSERAYGGVDGLDVDTVLRRKDRVDRWWLIPRLGSRLAHAGGFGRELRRHQDTLRRLYDAAFAESGADVLVDSTKDPSHGYVLATMPDVELHVVHLVRDSRAVAHSWQRTRFNPGSGADMERYSLLKTGAEWDAINVLIGALRHRSAGYQVLQYEDFVAAPGPSIDRILAAVGVPGHGPADGRVVLGDDHTVAGNPVRFKRGETRLRLDDEWQSAMPRVGRAAMTALTAPVLLRYGFPARTTPQTTGAGT